MAKRKSGASRGPHSLVLSLFAVILLLLTAYLRPDLISGLFGEETLDPSEIVYAPQSDRSDEIPGKLQVHFFDIGQGDSTLVITPDGKTMLIDAGPGSDEERLLGYLEALGIQKLDFVLFTHPHEDHIGGGDVVIRSFEIGRVLMPDCTSSSATFEKLLTVIEDKGLEIEIVEAGDSYSLSACEFTIYGPITIPKDDANNSSIVLKLTYGETSFLFSGDAEEKEEKEILLNYGDDLDSDVYQVGHHGSNTSSCKEFVNAISPEITVISCGIDNEYGHPHDEIISRLLSHAHTLYRTDLQGSILLLSDGKSVT